MGRSANIDALYHVHPQAQRQSDHSEVGWDAVVDSLGSNPPAAGRGTEAVGEQVQGEQGREVHAAAGGPSWDEVTVALREAREDSARIASERLDAGASNSCPFLLPLYTVLWDKDPFWTRPTGQILFTAKGLFVPNDIEPTPRALDTSLGCYR